MTLRRLYRRTRRHARFNFAVLLTIVVIAWVAVPQVAHWLDAVPGYNPAVYEPKDTERQAWQSRPGADLLARIPWETAFNVTLFVLVAVVWLTLVPTRRPPRH